AALRDSHDAGGAPMLPLVAALPESPDSLSVSELEVATTWAQRNTKRVVAATEKAESVEASFRAEGAEATAALRGLVAMTVSRGLQLAAASHDADEELLSALRVSLEDLALSPRASVPDSLVAVVDAAAKVVHSSNLKRIDDPSSVLVVVNKRRPLQPMSYV